MIIELGAKRESRLSPDLRLTWRKKLQGSIPIGWERKGYSLKLQNRLSLCHTLIGGFHRGNKMISMGQESMTSKQSNNLYESLHLSLKYLYSPTCRKHPKSV